MSRPMFTDLFTSFNALLNKGDRVSIQSVMSSRSSSGKSRAPSPANGVSMRSLVGISEEDESKITATSSSDNDQIISMRKGRLGYEYTDGSIFLASRLARILSASDDIVISDLPPDVPLASVQQIELSVNELESLV